MFTIFDKRFFFRYALVGQSSFITCQPVFCNRKYFIVGNGCNMFIPVLNKITGGIISSLVIINRYFVSIDFVNDAVKENNGHSSFIQFFEVAELFGFRGNRNDQTINRP